MWRGRAFPPEKQLMCRLWGRSRARRKELGLLLEGIKLQEAQVWQDGTGSDLGIRTPGWVESSLLFSHLANGFMSTYCTELWWGLCEHKTSIHQWQGHLSPCNASEFWPRKAWVCPLPNAEASHHQEAQRSLGNIEGIRAQVLVPQMPTLKEKWERCCMLQQEPEILKQPLCDLGWNSRSLVSDSYLPKTGEIGMAGL